MDPLTARKSDRVNLPMIDLTRLSHQDPAIRGAEASVLRAACVGSGFFYITEHGVSPALMEATFGQARAFFDLPLDDKMAIDLRASPALRGYSPLLSENTDPTARGDLHEAFDIGGVLFDGTDGEAFNRYPASLPALAPTLKAYRDEMLRLARALMSGFALALDLPPDYFTPLLTDPQAFLRILHYPPQSGAIDPDQIGIGAHSDYESLTILAQDAHPALQVSDGCGGWIWALPIPGTFVVNIGDQMARWTNDLFRSTLHRAINRTGARRYSIPFFFGPNPDALIDSLPGCVTPGRPHRYARIRAGDYSQQRKADSYGGAS